MTETEFRKAVTKSSWFDKYYYYSISITVLGVGLLSLYFALFGDANRQSTGVRILIVASAAFFILLGVISLRLLPNRYKVLKIESEMPIEEKKRITAEIMKEFGVTRLNTTKDFWHFYYQRQWWAYDYDIYIAFNNKTVFAAVIGKTNGGFIDFGQSERIRRKVSNLIREGVTIE
jgi:hypothetical protein